MDALNNPKLSTDTNTTRRRPAIYMDEKSYDESRRRRVSGQWAVHEGYGIRDNDLYSDGRRKFHYTPAGIDGLCQPIARLKNPDQVIRFACKYGMFGYWALWREPNPNKIRLHYDEPVDWIYAHARTINLCMEIGAKLQEGPDATRDFLDANIEQAEMPNDPIVKLRDAQKHLISPQIQIDLPVGRTELRDRLIFPTACGGKIHHVSWKPSPGSDDRSYRHAHPEEFARQLRRNLINCNLQGVEFSMELTDDAKGEEAGIRFDAMIQVAYWHLMQEILSGKGWGQCRSCGRLFFRHDKRQQYCPAVSDPRFKQDRESRCALTHRMQDHRNRKKAHT